MAEKNNNIFLKGSEYHITDNDSDAFRVKQGKVLVYIVPLKKGEPGRRSFIYEASPGEVLPSFCYRDAEYRQWRFCFAALDEAVIEAIVDGSTRVLKTRFCQKADISSYEIEGYNEGIVNQYRINTVSEDSFIYKSTRDKKKVSVRLSEMILSAFGKESISSKLDQSGDPLYDSISLIGLKCGIDVAPYEKICEACKNKPTVADIARISHFAYRDVILENGWYKKDLGALVVFDEDGDPGVCLPKGGSYILYDTAANESVKLSRDTAKRISPKAVMLYRSLPGRELTKKDIIRFCAGSIRRSDVILLILMLLVCALMGIITPVVSQKIYDEYIPLGSKGVLLQIGSLLISFMLANVLFTVVKNIIRFRITSRIANDFQNAVYDRLFNLPESFFRNYESADLAQRVMSAGQTAESAANVVILLIVDAVYIAVFIAAMLRYSVKLTLIGIGLALLYALCSYLIITAVTKQTRRSLELEARADSIMFQFINGISKLRMAGVEDRALYEYMKPYIRYTNTEQKKNNTVNCGGLLKLIAADLFTIVFYLLVIKGRTAIGLGGFIAFTTLFSCFTVYVIDLSDSLGGLRSIQPLIERLSPVLKEKTEASGDCELPGDISGQIEINNISFSYSADSPAVLKNVDLKIKAGEYVAIVGSSGCGKSTLLKLLLGFEKPMSGKIYYDNKDIDRVDKRELRKKMGVVLQDGKLISGSIFENISVTSENADLKDVEEAVRAVGLEEDIRQMPMGLHTVLSEDCSTISGGQQQRILIARAMVSKPKILFLDEATSALDNITQNIVCNTIEQMRATRIIIAHRLSTVIKCDRIIVLNEGSVAEQGTFEELMEKKGLFYELASRQMA